MKSCRCTNLFLALALAPALLAADWYPLGTGNQWVYRGTGGVATAPRVVKVGEAREFDGHRFYAVSGLLAGDAWLRNDGDRLMAWDEASGSEVLWYDFSTASGGSYHMALPRTSGTVTVTSRDASVTVPVGTFPASMTLDYMGVRTGDFSAASVRGESFAEGVGMLTQDVAPEGPQGRYELAYARIGSVTVYRGTENGISLSINEAKTHVRLSVDQPTEPTALRLYDESGSEVWTGGTRSDKGFTVITNEFSAELPTLRAGRYVVTGECGAHRISLPFTVE